MKANRWVCRVLGGAVVALLLFQPGPASASESVVGEAIRLYREGESVAARELLAKRIADEPDDIDAHLAYVQLRVLLGEREKLRAEYRAAAEADPDNPVLELARIVLLTRSLDQFKAFDRFLEANPGFPRGWEEYGRILLEGYRYKGAVRALEHAVEIDPNRSLSHLYLGLAHRSLGEQEAEERELRLASDLDPESGTIRLELGTTLCYGGAPEEAERILETVIDESPEDVEVLAILALTKHRLGKEADSERLREMVLEKNLGILDNLLYLGIQTRSAGLGILTKRLHELALFLDSTHVESYMQLGIYYRVIEEPEKAIEVYRAALRHGELNQLAWRNLGISYGETGNDEMAEKYIRKSLEVDPDYLIGWVDLGRVLEQLGRKEESIEVWRKVLGMAPYGWEAKEARHCIHYLELGEPIPALYEDRKPWKAPKPEAEK